MSRHSTLDLLATRCHLSHSSPVSHSSPLNEGRNLDSEINAQLPVSYPIFGLYGDGETFPKILSMRLIVGRALSVNKIRILFRKKKKQLIWNRIQTNPYGSERRLVPVSDWPDILLTDQWYFPVNRRRTRSQIWNLEPPSMPTLSACNIRIYLKVGDYEIENKTRVNTEYEWEKMAAASTSTSSRD